MDKHFQIAQLSDQTDCLEQIHLLEQKLTEQYGSEVALIAYSANKKDDSK